MRRLLLFFVGIYISLVSMSCDKHKSFFKKNKSDLIDLSLMSLNQLTNIDLCCDRSCFDKVTLDIIEKLDVACIRKDTIECTLNFTFNKKEKFKSFELVFK